MNEDTDVSTAEFFRTIHPDGLDGHLLEILKLPNQEQVWCTSIDDAVAAVSDESKNIFFGVGLRSAKKGDKDHTARLPALWVEVDAPLDRDQMERFEFAPSIIHQTRNGYHAYWLLREPETVDDDNREYLESLLRGLARALGADHCHDISRRLRVPGTMHFKGADGRLCLARDCPLPPFRTKIVSWHPDRRYNPSDFEHYFETPPSPTINRVLNKLVSFGLPERFRQALKTDEELRRAWRGERKPPEDATKSGYDAMLTAMLVHRGFSDSDIVAILHAYSRGKGREATEHYLNQTITKARDLVSEQKGGEGSQADKLVALALENAELFHDVMTKEPYGRITVDGHHEILRCRSRTFKTWLAREMYLEEQKAPGSEGLSSALNVIEGKARFDGEPREMSNRVALHEGAIWYDLTDADWRTVRITESGWEVVADPPPIFCRFEHHMPQVEPDRTGDVSRFLDFVHIEDPKFRLLLKIYVISCFVPGIPHPVPVLHGSQGSGKSTLFRLLRRLVDPSALEILSMPSDKREFVQVLSHHWMAPFDNVTDLRDWQSDALCRAVSGEGHSKRRLYTDDDDVIVRYQRCCMLNGINVSATRPDLLDRSILIKLDRIPPERRQTEGEMWDEFGEAKAGILGGSLNILVDALKLLPEVETRLLPRLADFARWACAIARALGCTEKDFLDAYGENVEMQNLEALQGHPVGSAVLAFMVNRNEWEGKPSDLLTVLELTAEKEGIDIKSKLWPKGAHILGRRLREVASNLIDAGVTIVDGGRTRDGRQIVIRKSHGSVTSDISDTTHVE